MAQIDVKNLSREITIQLKTRVAAEMKAVVTELYNEVVPGTPVRTGFCRANWNVSVGEPDYTVDGVRDPNASYPTPSAQIPDNPELQPMFVSNGVPYVGLLEDGSSTQAPSGWVQVAVNKVAANVRGYTPNNS